MLQRLDELLSKPQAQTPGWFSPVVATPVILGPDGDGDRVVIFMVAFNAEAPDGIWYAWADSPASEEDPVLVAMVLGYPQPFWKLVTDVPDWAREYADFNGLPMAAGVKRAWLWRMAQRRLEHEEVGIQ